MMEDSPRHAIHLVRRLARPGRNLTSRALRPLFRRFYLSRRRVHRINDMLLEVLPGVFPPLFFLSSRLLMSAVCARPLAGRRVMDMGTGSGVVGLHAARSGATVLAVDISEAAVRCAKMNSAFAPPGTMEVRASDLFRQVRSDERFDLIAWNPPFFPGHPLVDADHAWLAGEGFETIRRFSASAGRYLTGSGEVLLVVSSDMDRKLLRGIFCGDGWQVAVVQTRRGVLVDHFLWKLTR